MYFHLPKLSLLLFYAVTIVKVCPSQPKKYDLNTRGITNINAIEHYHEIETSIKKDKLRRYFPNQLSNLKNTAHGIIVKFKMASLHLGINEVSNKKKTSTLKAISYLFIWYFFTIVYNISNKQLLNIFPLPVTVTFLQLCLGIPLFLPIWVIKPPGYNFDDLATHAKIACTHSLGNLASVISFASGSISFTHVVKASEPIVAAFLSSYILGQTLPVVVYLTLLPIVLGVALASLKEISFTYLGFFSALASNVFYQLRIVLAKQEMSKNDSSNNTKITASNLFRVITIISAMLIFPLALLIEGYKINNVIRSCSDRGSLVLNILVSSFSYYMYNEVAFWLLDIIHPITHAVANTVKRVVIILVSIVILRAPVSILGLAGSMLAVFGTFLYSIAQHRYK